MTIQLLSKDIKDKKELSIIKNGNVLVLYYADWCPHCVSFKPIWNKFCQEMKKQQNPNFSIIDIEHTDLQKPENTQLLNEAQGFPTIKFYKPQIQTQQSLENNGIRFEGDRTRIDELINFVNTYARKQNGGVNKTKKQTTKTTTKGKKTKKTKKLNKLNKDKKGKKQNKSITKNKKRKTANTFNKDTQYFTERELTRIRKDLKKSEKIKKELILSMEKEFKV